MLIKEGCRVQGGMDMLVEPRRASLVPSMNPLLLIFTMPEVWDWLLIMWVMQKLLIISTNSNPFNLTTGARIQEMGHKLIQIGGLQEL